MRRQMLTSLVPAAALLSAVGLAGAAENHPFPQPRVGLEDPTMDAERTVSEDGMTTYWKTAKTHFPQSFPFQEEKPSNLLDTVYELIRDSGGDPIPNTLPSTPEHPYNLHPDPIVEDIDPRSPRWDLGMIINGLRASVDPEDRRATNREFFPGGIGVPADPRRGRIDRKENEGPGIIEELATPEIDYEAVQFGIDILEGNSIDREYSGMPLLHYMGPLLLKKVDPETRTVTVHQAWTRTYLKSDTMFIDPTTIPADVEWTVRYEISCLHWGHEDFAPFVVLFDDPQDVGIPNLMHVGFDQTFFPMEEGKKYTFDIKMPPHRYWNLTYNWGWRVHPPRVQAIEKAVKAPMGKTLVQWEKDVFGENPRASEEAKLQAIGMISDLAPAKRMWQALRAIKATHNDGHHSSRHLIALVAELEAAFEDWKDRTKLPRGIEVAEGFDQTLVFLNSHLYGGMNDVLTEAEESWPEWQTRGAVLETKIYNGDYFPHFYMNVDFGGRRGWSNIYQNTIPLGGQGPWFTFGLVHMARNLQIGTTPMPEMIPAATRPSELKLPRGMVRMGAMGRPHRYHTVPALPPATYEAIHSKWMPHPDPEGRIAIHRTARGLGEHNVVIEYRYDPSQRLRFYQFDPMHHNEDVLSVH